MYQLVSRFPMRRGTFEGEGAAIVKYKDYRPCAAAMRLFCQVTLTTCFYFLTQQQPALSSVHTTRVHAFTGREHGRHFGHP